LKNLRHFNLIKSEIADLWTFRFHDSEFTVYLHQLLAVAFKFLEELSQGVAVAVLILNFLDQFLNV